MILFFLPGDKLENTMVKIECPLPTKTCQPSVSKMYRPAEIHKAEMSRQTREQLRQGLIRSSTSPWNARVFSRP